MSTLISVLSRALAHDLRDHTQMDLMKMKVLPPDANIRDIQCHSMYNSFSKKFEDESSDLADQLAIQKFLDVNQRMGSLVLDKGKMSSAVQHVVDEMKEDLYRFFFRNPVDCIVSATSILSGIDVGPGASVSASGVTPYHKLGVGPMSTTSLGLYQLYESWTKGSPTWNDVEITRRSIAGGPLVVLGSKLSTVPKNRDVSRTICTEPLLNMMFQKGIGSIIEQALTTRFGIRYKGGPESVERKTLDYSSVVKLGEVFQPDRNRELARRGSIDGSYATIDLSSASDSVSLQLVDLLLPKEVVGWLKATRSTHTELPNKSLVELHMLSSMGNGYTFPLQTAIFASLVRAVYTVKSIPIRRPNGPSLGNYGVFGDDIICVSEATNLVLETLEALGFIPNSDKTYTDVYGRFRESCGGDYHEGINVRGVYCKSLKHLQDKFTLINLINDWSVKTGIACARTVAILLRVVGRNACFVPQWENHDSGIRAPLSFALEHGVRRVLNRDTNAQGFLYSCYKVRAVELTWVWGFTFLDKEFQDIGSNPAAAMLCGLRGNLRNGKMSLRSRDNPYTYRSVVVPGWEAADLATGASREGLVRNGYLTTVNLIG